MFNGISDRNCEKIPQCFFVLCRSNNMIENGYERDYSTLRVNIIFISYTYHSQTVVVYFMQGNSQLCLLLCATELLGTNVVVNMFSSIFIIDY